MASVSRLVTKVRKYNPEADVDLIRRAFDAARRLHGDQLRDSGEAFIEHPLGVADGLADLELDTQTIVAALLHDVLEDTDAKPADIKAEFGSEVFDLIDGVTKLGRIEFRTHEEHQVENLRKMLLAMSKDLRVILIKLADRLHNMRTLEHIPADKQSLKAMETLEIYAPLAHRLGIMQLQADLEDLAFQVLEPKRFEQVAKMVAEQKEERDAYVKEVVNTLKTKLKSVNVAADVSGRSKHFYSIYQKMAQKEKEFNEIYDLAAIRVLVESVKDCYGALGTIHALWKPIPGRFKDYIAMPKFNMYQSLHTTVIGPSGRPLEIQIRTTEMHRTAEYGVAAHWRYKEGTKEPDKFEERIAWLRQMMEWQSEVKDPREFMESLKIDLFKDEVFVFTPKGEVVRLPAGSTPIDFAYAIHTDVGHHCVGAKANNKIVPLEYRLKMGDIMEVLTSKANAGPSKDWLTIARTNRAKSKIRQWFSKESREDSEHVGREALIKALRKHGLSLSVALQGQLLERIAKDFNFRKSEDLLASIGSSVTSPKQVAGRIISALTTADEEERRLEAEVVELPTGRRRREAGPGIKVKGVEGLLIRLAHCCNPVPGDGILGFVTQGRGVSIHRLDCPNAVQLAADPERLVDVSWDVRKPATFQVEMQVEALDRTKLLRDISTVLGDSGVNILSASVSTTKDRVAVFRFVFEIGNLGHLDSIVRSVKKVDSVFEARRVVPR